MRYGIFSDVHANTEAFEAVLNFFKTQKVDRYIFAGDIVGYGANPQNCLDLLLSLNAVMVAGNHDWAVGGRMELFSFRDSARDAIVWSRSQVSAGVCSLLEGLPLIERTSEFECVHGTLSRPEDFEYMSSSRYAAKTFYTMETPICFVGHSHIPGVFEDAGASVEYYPARSFAVRKGHRYIVNVGSVGQPRDGDPRACVCTWDTELNQIDFHRVEYDIAMAQKKILDTGLPASLADRLPRGR
jgi:diadenosine tetraphosphatase ApaH/serine/threonine PP2A family protein phosphatase